MMEVHHIWVHVQPQSYDSNLEFSDFSECFRSVRQNHLPPFCDSATARSRCKSSPRKRAAKGFPKPRQTRHFSVGDLESAAAVHLFDQAEWGYNGVCIRVCVKIRPHRRCKGRDHPGWHKSTKVQVYLGGGLYLEKTSCF